MTSPDSTNAGAGIAKGASTARPRSDQMNGTVLLLLAALAWGVGNVSQKTILDHLDAFAATGITCLVGAAVLFPMACLESRQLTGPKAGSFPLLAQVALLFTLAATLLQIGYGHTSVTNAGFMVNTAAVLTPVLGWLLFHQRPPFLIWPASVCALAGVYLMGGGSLSALVYGDLLALGAAVAFAVWNLLVAKYVVQYRRPSFMTLVQLSCCGIICLVTSALLYGVPSAANLWAALPEILFLGIVSKGLAYVLMAFGLRYVSVACAAVLVSAESVFGAACAIVFLSESPGLIRVIGGFLTIGGVVLASCAPAKVETDRQPV